MHRTRYFTTARNTGYNPGHQSPEQNYHMEDGIWWEPDASHAELVISLLGDGPRGAKVTTSLAKGAVENLKDAAELFE